MLLHAGIPLTITSVLWATSLYEVSLPQVIAAFILCWIPGAYGEWVNGTREKFPLFALIGVVYWLAYAVPLFWLKHDISLVTENIDPPRTRNAVALLGHFWCGCARKWHGGGWGLALYWIFQAGHPPESARWHYLRFLLLAAVL